MTRAQSLVMNVDTDGLGSKPQEKIAHGVLAGVKMNVKPLIGSTMSEEETKEYFCKGIEEIRKGFELVPGKLRIRVATKEDTDRFDIRIYGRRDQLPQINEVLIEYEDIDPMEFGREFSTIRQVQLALCLSKKEHFFLRSVYSFLKGDNRPSENLILEPIPMSEVFSRFGYTIYSEDIHKMMCIFQKISRADLTNNSIRIACNRFLRSHHNLLPDDRLIDLCIAMEALFLGGEYQKSDLGMGQVIGLACSMLIGRENTERKDIRDTIEFGFNLRNKVVHGYEIDYNRRKRIGEILPDFEDSLRRSILRLL